MSDGTLDEKCLANLIHAERDYWGTHRENAHQHPEYERFIENELFMAENDFSVSDPDLGMMLVNHAESYSNDEVSEGILAKISPSLWKDPDWVLRVGEEYPELLKKAITKKTKVILTVVGVIVVALGSFAGGFVYGHLSPYAV